MEDVVQAVLQAWILLVDRWFPHRLQGLLCFVLLSLDFQWQLS